MLSFNGSGTFALYEKPTVQYPTYDNSSAVTAEAIPVVEYDDTSTSEDDETYPDVGSSDSEDDEAYPNDYDSESGGVEEDESDTEDDETYPDNGSSDSEDDEAYPNRDDSESDAVEEDESDAEGYLAALIREESQRDLGRDKFIDRNPPISDTEVDDGEVATASFCDA